MPFAPIVRTCSGDQPSPSDVVELRAEVVTDAQGRFAFEYPGQLSQVLHVNAQAVGALLAADLHVVSAVAVEGRVMRAPLTSLLGRRREPAAGVLVYITVTGV